MVWVVSDTRPLGCNFIYYWKEFKRHEKTKLHRKRKEAELEYKLTKAKREKAAVINEKANKGEMLAQDELETRKRVNEKKPPKNDRHDSGMHEKKDNKKKHDNHH